MLVTAWGHGTLRGFRVMKLLQRGRRWWVGMTPSPPLIRLIRRGGIAYIHGLHQWSCPLPPPPPLTPLECIGWLLADINGLHFHGLQRVG